MLCRELSPVPKIKLFYTSFDLSQNSERTVNQVMSVKSQFNPVRLFEMKYFVCEISICSLLLVVKSEPRAYQVFLHFFLQTLFSCAKYNTE